jgi:hypothetical protein
MVLIWLVLGLLALDLAALLFAADTRPGLEHSARPRVHPRLLGTRLAGSRPAASRPGGPRAARARTRAIGG